TLDERVVDVAMEEEARTRLARLPAHAERHARDRTGDRTIHVGVGEDDVRVLPTELEHRGDDVLCRRGEDGLPRRDAAGELDLADAGVRHERVARSVPAPGDDVEDA